MVPVERHPAEYFRRREAKELALASKASSEEIRQIYLSLAERYRYLAENAEQAEQQGDRRRVTDPDNSTPWD